MESWSKQDWLQYVEASLVRGRFVYRAFFPNKAPFLFACNVFRRRGHRVHVFFEVVEHGPPCTGVVILPYIDSSDITIRRDSVLQDIMSNMSGYSTVRVRGCGTTIQMVNDVVHLAICDGWFVAHTQLGTLTKTVEGVKQHNTTMVVTLSRGSDGHAL